MLPFQTVRETLQRYVFLYCYTFERDCLTGNDTCLSDGRKM